MPNKSSWDRVNEYIKSLENTVVYSVGDFFFEVDQYLEYLTIYYHMSGKWGFTAHTTEEDEVVCFIITRTDNYGKTETVNYRVKLHICTKKVGNIYIDKNTDTYYKCQEYNAQTRQYKWRQVTKVLWWYFETWGKKAFWSDGGTMQAVD